MKLTERQCNILEEVANTFIAPDTTSGEHKGFWASKGADRVAPGKIAEVIASQPRPAREEFIQLLKILDSNLLGMTWAGPMKKFLDLTFQQREKLFVTWSNSPVKKLRKAFSSLKKLSTFIYFSSTEDGYHPDFKAIQYPGPPLGDADKLPRLSELQIDNDSVLTCEVLVIGSGAGGGVIAGELAGAGKDVIIADKGPYLHGADFTQEEGKMIETLYDGKGAITSSDGQVSIFAGSCVGGGTTVNWAGSFRTPDYILQEWASEHGVPFLTSQSFQDSLNAVVAEIGVNTNYSLHNLQNKLLLDGSRKLGQQVELIPRNERQPGAEDFQKLGFSSLGDRYGIKQGTAQTYIRKATTAGARLLSQCQIEKIAIKNGRATGAEAVCYSPKGHKKKVFIQAEKIVVAAGAIQTPALLKRSGLNHDHIGKHLYLHPTVGVSATYTQKSEAWFGPMMSVVNDQFARLDGNYGFKLETPPTHPGLIAMSLPWSGAHQFKEDMLKASHIASFIAIVRDKFPGYITIDKEGQPIVHYKLHGFDLKHLINGMEEASRLHFANDCEQIIYPHFGNHRFNNTGKRADLEKFIHNLPVWGWRPNQFSLYSAHQMGTCRMGEDKKTHPTAHDGSLYEVPNIYIGDGSAFPSASGVNPMLSIMALAHHTAQGLK
ncbi:GMC family oxidoreductase [uncultured Imperialibacter sp.]|uniref:GMC family oxidoreductase n=1 Tax=uncultured Imperialibacter sp. TaxID=1672639 RepID=UPI0030D986EB|tara:strand:+ start:170037 stop:172013 length:1977 start_codon:yes stop_codon:yes gene_type:complete